MPVSYVAEANTGSDVLASTRTVNRPGGIDDADIAGFLLTRWNEVSDFPAVTPPPGAVVRGIETLGTPSIGGGMESQIYLVEVGAAASFTFSWGVDRWGSLKAIFMTGQDSGLDLATVPFQFVSGTDTDIAAASVDTVVDAGLMWFLNTSGYTSAVTHTPPTNFTLAASHPPSASAYRISPSTGTQTSPGATVSAEEEYIAALLAVAPADVVAGVEVEVAHGIVLGHSVNAEATAQAEISHGLILGHAAAVEITNEANISHGITLGHALVAESTDQVEISHGIVLGHSLTAETAVEAEVSHGIMLGHQMAANVGAGVAVNVSHGIVLGHQLEAVITLDVTVAISHGIVLGHAMRAVSEAVVRGRPIQPPATARPLQDDANLRATQGVSSARTIQPLG